MNIAPIVLLTYNRPEHTRRTLEALLQNELCADSELYIFSDGWRTEEDRAAVLQVREQIAALEGFKAVHMQMNSSNVGLAANVMEGVTQVVRQHGRVIVVEDDLIVSPTFLSFMNRALERYKDEERVGHVHGFCYPDMPGGDAYLIRWAGSWGWATWERAWEHFNADGRELLKELKRRRLTRLFDFNGTYKYTRMLRRQIKGVNNSWAIRWYASLFLSGMLALNAGESLVQNIGFDGSGTHSGDQEIFKAELCTRELSVEVEVLEENAEVRQAFGCYYVEANGFWAKVKRRVERHLKIKL